MTNIEYSSSLELTKAHEGEAWGVFCEYFRVKWPHYHGVQLHLTLLCCWLLKCIIDTRIQASSAIQFQPVTPDVSTAWSPTGLTVINTLFSSVEMMYQWFPSALLSSKQSLLFFGRLLPWVAKLVLTQIYQECSEWKIIYWKNIAPIFISRGAFVNMFRKR